jgi:WXG100 family type VII secretion target
MFGMSGIIRVTPAELESMATRYNHESGEVSTQIERLDTMMKELTSMWEGASSVAFEEQYVRLKPHFHEMRELLSEVGVQLNRTGNALRDADQQIASQIRG